jgi:hypothetical protein
MLLSSFHPAAGSFFREKGKFTGNRENISLVMTDHIEGASCRELQALIIACKN